MECLSAMGNLILQSDTVWDFFSGLLRTDRSVGCLVDNAL